MKNENARTSLLLEAIGIDPRSFERVVEWSLCEHLISVLASLPEFGAALFELPDAMKRFRDVLVGRTKRRWSPHDVEALFERLKIEKGKHYRRPIAYEEYLKLILQAPLECVRCGRRPPSVILHVDHIVPASRGGSSKRANLQFLCAECNLRKSNKREVSDPWLDLQ